MAKNLTSVVNAVRVLRLLGAGKEWMGLSELAGKLDLSTSTTHRLLSTLQASGLVERRSSPIRYGLAAGVAIAPGEDEVKRILELATPVMTRLKGMVHATVHLARLVGDQLEFLAAVESDAMMRVTPRLEKRFPAHLGAAGKLLLAMDDVKLGEELCEQAELYNITGRGVKTGEQLREQLELVRQLGYGRNISESEMGMYSLAYPLRSYDGRVSYALTVAGPLLGVDPGPDGQLSDVEQVYLQHLRSAVGDIEELLGL